MKHVARRRRPNGRPVDPSKLARAPRRVQSVATVGRPQKSEENARRDMTAELATRCSECGHQLGEHVPPDLERGGHRGCMSESRCDYCPCASFRGEAPSAELAQVWRDKWVAWFCRLFGSSLAS